MGQISLESAGRPTECQAAQVEWCTLGPAASSERVRAERCGSPGAAGPFQAEATTNAKALRYHGNQRGQEAAKGPVWLQGRPGQSRKSEVVGESSGQFMQFLLTK